MILPDTSLLTDHLYFVHAVPIGQKFMAWVEQYHSRGQRPRTLRGSPPQISYCFYLSFPEYPLSQIKLIHNQPTTSFIDNYPTISFHITYILILTAISLWSCYDRYLGLTFALIYCMYTYRLVWGNTVKPRQKVCNISLNIYKEPTRCNLAVYLLVTAIMLYMFRTLFASILRSP